MCFNLLALSGVLATVVCMFTVTESAAKKVASLIDDEHAAGMMLRVAVRPGGC
jgi:Fe-S cluster assembly iron-binding protein IscA